MPRYFFHARHAGELLIDEQGVELSDLSSAREHILEALVESGVELLPDWRIEITDEAGVLQLIVSLSDLTRQQ